MNKVEMTIAAKFREVLFGLGFMACLAPALTAGPALAEEAAVSAQSRVAAGEMRVLGRQIAAGAWQSDLGQESTFADLARRIARFEEQKSQLGPDQFAKELSVVDVAWQPVKRAAQTLIEAGPEIVFSHEVAGKYAQEMDSMQREFSAVANIVHDQNYGSETSSLAQRNLWLNERINRNINSIVAGSDPGDSASAELRADSAELLGNIEALTRGDTERDIRKITDPVAIDAMSSAFRRFSTVSTALDRVIREAPRLREAAAARNTILSSADAFDETLDALVVSVGAQAGGDFVQSSTPVAYIVLPILLGLGLVLFQFLMQRRRAQLTQPREWRKSLLPCKKSAAATSVCKYQRAILR